MREQSPLAVLVHCNLGPCLREAGWRVVELAPAPGLHHAPQLVEAHCPHQPDLFLQQEHLAPRTLFSGLDELPCPTLFYAQDPQLNAWWQTPYSQLFDAVASTQRDTLDALGTPGAARLWLPWHTPAATFPPHSKRPRALGFVGRINEFRPIRRRFADLLAQLGADVASDLDWGHMADFYRDTRIAPNELLAGEINLRLFESTALGCLVVTPRLGDGLAELYTEGQDILCYDDAFELAEHLARAKADPAWAFTLAMNGAARQRARHTAAHRARTLLDFLPDISRARATGDEAARLLALGQGRALSAGLYPVDPAPIVRSLAARPRCPESLATVLELLWHGQARDAALTMATHTLADPDNLADIRAAAAVAAVGLFGDNTELARLATTAWATINRQPTADPGSPAWFAAMAQATLRAGHRAREGFFYVQESHLPQTALEWTYAGILRHPDNQDLLARTASMLRATPGGLAAREGVLAALWMRRPNDWRTDFELAEVYAKSFLPEKSLGQLDLAADKAAKSGKMTAFNNALARLDTRGAIRRAWKR